MSEELQLDSIGQIHITVDDIDRAVTFYRDVLGMKFLFDVPGQAMAFFDCGGVRLYLGKAESESFRSSPLIYYRVDDIHGAKRILADRGVTFEQAPHVVHKTDEHELWLAAFKDPAGNWVHLMSEVEPA